MGSVLTLLRNGIRFIRIRIQNLNAGPDNPDEILFYMSTVQLLNQLKNDGNERPVPVPVPQFEAERRKLKNKSFN